MPSCPREIFAERFDGVLGHYSRRTNGTTELLTAFALQAGGEGGARLASKAGVLISPDTLLRLLHALDDDGWKKYLVLEEAVNDRADVQMQILVRWALAHGARSRR